VDFPSVGIHEEVASATMSHPTKVLYQTTAQDEHNNDEEKNNEAFEDSNSFMDLSTVRYEELVAQLHSILRPTVDLVPHPVNSLDCAGIWDICTFLTIFKMVIVRIQLHDIGLKFLRTPHGDAKHSVSSVVDSNFCQVLRNIAQDGMTFSSTETANMEQLVCFALYTLSHADHLFSAVLSETQHLQE